MCSGGTQWQCAAERDRLLELGDLAECLLQLRDGELGRVQELVLRITFTQKSPYSYKTKDL